MGFEKVMNENFNRTMKEVDYVRKTYNAVKDFGFNDDNSMASVCVCRDEISQTIRSIVKHIWGEAFNFSSLAGMFTAGKTGLKAAIHHAPQVDSRERYVFYVIPHIAINEDGKSGICKRRGIKEESCACGALCLFLSELHQGKLLIISKYNLLALPVIDENGYMHGIIRVDDIIDLLLPPEAKKKRRRV